MAETDGYNPAVNEFVKKLLFERHQTAVDLADAMNLSNDSAYKLLRRTDWRISEIRAAGNFLNTNLFELFVTNKVDEAGLNEQLKKRDDELALLKQKFELIEQENKYLKELVEMAKMKLKH